MDSNPEQFVTPVSPGKTRSLEVDMRTAARNRSRDIAGLNRRDKRLNGSVVARDPNSLYEKLRKLIGGKSASRLVKAERRAARAEPEAVEVLVRAEGSPNVETAQRAVDYALVKTHDETLLVLRDGLQLVSVNYEPSLIDQLEPK